MRIYVSDPQVHMLAYHGWFGTFSPSGEVCPAVNNGILLEGIYRVIAVSSGPLACSICFLEFYQISTLFSFTI